jgi:hypothetical protein
MKLSVGGLSFAFRTETPIETQVCSMHSVVIYVNQNNPAIFAKSVGFAARDSL